MSIVSGEARADQPTSSEVPPSGAEPEVPPKEPRVASRTTSSARKAPSRAKKTPSKSSGSPPLSGITISNLPWAELWKPLAVLVAIVTVLATALSIILLSLIFRPGLPPQDSTPAGVTMGGTNTQPVSSDSMTEDELRAMLNDVGVTAFWAAPESGATYTATVGSTLDVLIRYIPEGASVEEVADQTLMIATYPVPGAYAALEVAAQEANAISSVTEDGALVYYRSDLPSNVYLAYPDQPFQIEVFDPSGGRALELATEPGRIQPVN